MIPPEGSGIRRLQQNKDLKSELTAPRKRLLQQFLKKGFQIGVLPFAALLVGNRQKRGELYF